MIMVWLKNVIWRNFQDDSIMGGIFKKRSTQEMKNKFKITVLGSGDIDRDIIGTTEKNSGRSRLLVA